MAFLILEVHVHPAGSGFPFENSDPGGVALRGVRKARSGPCSDTLRPGEASVVVLKVLKISLEIHHLGRGNPR